MPPSAHKTKLNQLLWPALVGQGALARAAAHRRRTQQLHTHTAARLTWNTTTVVVYCFGVVAVLRRPGRLPRSARRYNAYWATATECGIRRSVGDRSRPQGVRVRAVDSVCVLRRPTAVHQRGHAQRPRHSPAAPFLCPRTRSCMCRRQPAPSPQCCTWHGGSNSRRCCPRRRRHRLATAARTTRVPIALLVRVGKRRSLVPVVGVDIVLRGRSVCRT